MSDTERSEKADAPTATVSSLKSQDSTEQLIAEAKDVERTKSATSKSVEAGSEEPNSRRRVVVFLGLAQVVLGALLVGAGALAVVKGAALSRVGAGLWAGCVAVVAGVVGVMAGINDCYGLYGVGSGSPLLTAFLALSLLSLACGNSAAVLAASGLQRDSLRQPTQPASFTDEMQAWTPVLTNIALLIIASLHCLVSIITIYHLSKRICPCFRPKQPYDHNQFDPFKAPYLVHVDETKGVLEKKKKSEEQGEYDSANSKEKLVSHWLGRGGAPAGRPRRAPPRKPRPPHVLLVPHHGHRPHPASTLGRMPANCVMVPPPRYATLPLPPPAPLYYPIHDHRLRRRRSPRTHGERRRREHARERGSQLARSLERIHRKRRADPHLTDAELKRTYTGLDRAYAEQFIAVIDESRHAAQHDSLGSTATSDSTNS